MKVTTEKAEKDNSYLQTVKGSQMIIPSPAINIDTRYLNQVIN